MRACLITAGIYNLIWGVIIIAFPQILFASVHLDMPNYIFIWKTVGLTEIVFGGALLIAARHAYNNWIVIAMTVVYKFFASLFYFLNVYDNSVLWSLSNYIFIDNIIWILPFSVILYFSYRFHLSSDSYELDFFGSEGFTWDMFETNEGLTLEEMTHRQPTLMVFLRHFGCTFCREAMRDISEQRHLIESKGSRILVVHMLEDEDTARERLAKFGLDDLPTISDPEKLLYKKFQLKQGSVTQLFGLKVWLRGIVVGVFKGLGIGSAMGDPYQMPGVFLLHKGKIVNRYIHESASDRPEYVQLADCPGC